MEVDTTPLAMPQAAVPIDSKRSETQLKEWQLNAVHNVVEHLVDGRGCILHGGLGSGKTRIGLRACVELWFARCQIQALAQNPIPATVSSNTNGSIKKTPANAGLKILIVCPASITHQWVYEESQKEAIPPELFMDFSGKRSTRHARFDDWMDRGGTGLLHKTKETDVEDVEDASVEGVTIHGVESAPEPTTDAHASKMDAAIRKFNVVFCVCSYEMLHKDLGGIAEGHSKLYRHWDVLLIDEAHKFRNGVTRYSSRKSSDASDTQMASYQRLQETLIRNFKPRLLAVSATPVVNHQMDIYSLLCWANMDPKRMTKQAWLVNATADFKSNIVEFRKKHLVNIKVPPVPPVTCHTPELVRSRFEIDRAKHFYTQLSHRSKEFLFAMKKMMTTNNEATRHEATYARNRWLAAVTRSTLEELWPGCYTVHFQKNADGSVAPPQYSSISSDHAAAVPLPKLQECTKLNWIVQKAKTLRELAKTDVECSRVVIFCQFVSPLVLLGRLLKAHVPDVPVFEHFGALSRENKNKNVEAFFATKNGGILLATRASMGVGKNLDCSRVVFKLDNDWSQALEDQATGRVVRPLIQEKHEWHEYTPVFKDALHASATPFCIQKWMRQVMNSKNQTASSVLTESFEEITDDVECDSQPEEPLANSTSASTSATGTHMHVKFAHSAHTETTVQTLSSLINMLTFALTESAPEVVHRQKNRLPPRKTIHKANNKATR